MKFDFQNKEGHTLSGRLDLPVNKPKAFALFAHCFTCSKDLNVVNTISKTLTEEGIAVLRFDFTGLGSSEGEFSNTNFSSNVEDLLSACASLSEKHGTPELLIGHSLGGAAVLKAASMLPKVKAVATIAAPSDIKHLNKLFEKDLEKIEKEDMADVSLAGRKFTITKQFIKDINEATILEEIKNLKKALLVMHSPIDATVSIEHAAHIFQAARHPKSFVSLDDADHLLMKKEDAKYAAGIIGAWAARYLSFGAQENYRSEKDEVVVKSRSDCKFTQDIYTHKHHLVADEPFSVKGNDLGLNPYELLLASLGACTSMTLRMYAEFKDIALEQAIVTLKQEKIEFPDNPKEKIDQILKTIELRGDITEAQRTKLYEIAEKCPVNRTLKSKILIETYYH